MGKIIKGITLEIDGDTTPLGKALHEVEGRAKKTQKELLEIQRALKFDPKNTELLSQKMRVLGKSLSETKEKLVTLKKAQEEATKKLQSGELPVEAYEALRREILQTERELSSLEQEIGKTTRSWRDHSATLQQAGKGLENAGSKMASVGKTLSASVTAPLVGLGVAAGKAFLEVDEALDTMVTKTGASGEALDGLQEVFESTYGAFPATAQEVGDAIGDLNTAFGLTGKALEEQTRAFLSFSKINRIDVTQAVLGAKGVVTQYGLSLSSLPAVLDAVNVAGQKTGANVSSLMDTMARQATVARDLHLPMEEMALLLGKIDQSGLDAERTLSYLSRAQAQGAKEGKTLSQSLQEFSTVVHSSASETEKLEVATRLFGTKGGGQMLSAVQSGALELGSLQNEMKEMAGSVQKTFEATLDPLDKVQSAFNRLKLAGSDLFTVLQEVAAPLVEKLAEMAQGLLSGWRALSPSTQELLVKLLAIAAAVGPLLLLIGKLTQGVGSLLRLFAPLLAFLAANPIVLAIVAIGAAVGGLVALVLSHGESIKASLSHVAGWIQARWESVKGFFSGLWSGVKDLASSAWSSVKENASSAWEGVKGAWSGTKAFFGDLFSHVGAIASTAWEKMKLGVRSVSGAILSSFNSAIDGVKEKILGLVKWVTEAWKSITQGLANAWKKVKGIFSSSSPAPRRNDQPRASGLSWYDKGGIFTRPAIIGVGEKRPEFVGALDDLRKIIREESKRSITINVNGAVLQKDQDIRDVGRKLAREIARYS